MFKILIIGLIIFFTLPIILRLLMRIVAGYARRKQQEFINNMFGQAFGQGATNDDDGINARDTRQRAHTSRRPSSRRGKRIDPSDGEYVDFEEIIVDTRTASSDGSDPSAASSSFVAESQIIDVEWEDIK